jgi:hypothetical protein
MARAEAEGEVMLRRLLPALGQTLLGDEMGIVKKLFELKQPDGAELEAFLLYDSNLGAKITVTNEAVTEKIFWPRSLRTPFVGFCKSAVRWRWRRSMPKPLPPVISEDEIGTTEYLRLREETLRRYSRPHDPYRRRQDPGPEPRYSRLIAQRGWDGVERYAPDSGRVTPGAELVTSDYAPLANLKSKLKDD